MIAAISSVRRLVTNDQRVREWSILYISNSFLIILAFLNNAVFFSTPTFYIIPSFSIYLSNSFATLPRALITTGTTSSSGTFPLFPFFLPYSYISWYSSIGDYPLSLFLVNYNYVLSSCYYHVSHWTLISHNTFASSYSFYNVSIPLFHVF